MKINPLIFILFFAFAFVSCVKEFQPKVDAYEALLVVDGMITDKPGPYTIKLSTSTKIIQYSAYKPYGKCKVVMMDNAGNKEVLTEVNPGIYKTDSLKGIQGIVGRKYKIAIATPENEFYESAEETLKKSVGIKSVYAEIQHKPDLKLFYGRDGYQFYIDTEIPETDTNYYLWKLESTFKFKTDFPWLDNPFIPCYRTKKIKELFILEKIKTRSEAVHFPLNFEDTYTKALLIRYSLYVAQYNIDELAYKYWNAIKKIAGNQGELYTQQPYQITNNIKNLSNPEKPALGYFTAAGFSEKRIFVDRPYIPFRYPRCPSGPDTVDVASKDWPREPDCLDCKESGTTQKPDFWVD